MKVRAYGSLIALATTMFEIREELNFWYPRMPINSTQLDTCSAKLDAMHAEIKWLSTPSHQFVDKVTGISPRSNDIRTSCSSIAERHTEGKIWHVLA